MVKEENNKRRKLKKNKRVFKLCTNPRHKIDTRVVEGTRYSHIPGGTVLRTKLSVRHLKKAAGKRPKRYV